MDQLVIAVVLTDPVALELLAELAGAAVMLLMMLLVSASFSMLGRSPLLDTHSMRALSNVRETEWNT